MLSEVKLLKQINTVKKVQDYIPDRKQTKFQDYYSSWNHILSGIQTGSTSAL